VSAGEVKDYWLDRYGPANMVVAAAGNVDHEALCETLESAFEGRSGRKTLRSGTPPQPNRGVNVFRRPTEQAHIVIGTEGLPRSHDDRHVLGVIDTVLGGGMSSRLFQEVREKRGLAYSVYSYRSLFADTGTFAVYAGTTPQNAETVVELILKEIDQLTRDGITETELKRAKGHLKGSLVLSSEDPGSRMNQLGRQQLTLGEIQSIDQLIERFDSVEMDDIKRVVGNLFGSNGFRVTIVGPFDEDAFDRYAA
jgi:predicted Zn-dependent peptidase